MLFAVALLTLSGAQTFRGPAPADVAGSASTSTSTAHETRDRFDPIPAPTGDAAQAAVDTPDDSHAAATTKDSAEPGRVAGPIHLEIPEILVNAPVVDVGVTGSGTVEVPRDPHITGWFREGARPGERGPAVILGHVDSYEGPAVFYALQDLETGHEIRVYRADGTVGVFAVTEVEWVRKDDFPTAKVYGQGDAATLRLVTCGGDFDEEAGHYEHNLIVYAAHVGETHVADVD